MDVWKEKYLLITASLIYFCYTALVTAWLSMILELTDVAGMSFAAFPRRSIIVMMILDIHTV